MHKISKFQPFSDFEYLFRKRNTISFCVLSEAAENNVNPGFRQNSSVIGEEFDKTCSGEERAFPSTTAPKKSGGDCGFTCCVPGCFSNNKKNPELSFYNFPNGKSPESQELRKKWIHLISRKNFTPTLGHRVCSQHFLGGRKTYMNCLPIIVTYVNNAKVNDESQK